MKDMNSAEWLFGTFVKKPIVSNRFVSGFFTIVVIIISVVNTFAYTPPIGIPNPSSYFSTFGEIDQPTPSSAMKCPAWPSAPTTGCYYVDKTSSTCTNTSNPFGYPNKPRCTPPEGELAAGSYVYIHAGTYTPMDSDGDRFDWHGLGTAANPIWITGNASNRPVFTDSIHIGLSGSTSYMVIENIAMSGGRGIWVAPYNNSYFADHVIIRGCVLTGTGSVGDGGGIGIGFSADSFPTAKIQYVVVYNNSISRYGIDGNPGSDQCGVYQGFHTYGTWVLNNTIFDNGADGVAGSHDADYTSKLAKYYYIGGNKIYSNGENCIDIKTTDGIIISGNTCTGPCAREQGWGIVLHYGANSLPCKNALVQYNTIYNVSSGIVMPSVGCDNCSYIGNKIYNATNAYGCMSDPAWNGWGISIDGSHGTIRVTDNTCYNCERGVINVKGLLSTDVLINERNTVSTVPLDLNSLSNTPTSSTPSTTVSGTTTTTPPTTDPTTGTTVTGTTTPTTTSTITTSRGTPLWNKKIKLFRR